MDTIGKSEQQMEERALLAIMFNDKIKNYDLNIQDLKILLCN